MPEVKALIASVLQMSADALREEDGADTIASWDSLKTLLIASAIEIEMGITLPSGDIDRLTSVRAVREICARHAAA